MSTCAFLSSPEFGKTTAGVVLTAKNMDDEAIASSNAQLDGRFAFSSSTAGLYQVCVKVNEPQGWFDSKKLTMKFHLAIQVGHSSTDYDALIKKEHLSDVQLQLRRLQDRTQDIADEVAYQEDREARSRDTSESTNTRVMWWSIGQTLVMLVSAAWQIRHLKNFFEAKKLV